ncbi:MAG TPA: MarR family transcriptional regulator [Bryobacteraceae bacterium]|nr:MarR family transcriptional regulator [Bryobacteraceae bacterium]
MSPFLELFDLIGELSRRRYQVGERTFATLGLNHTEARLLALLHKNGGDSPQDALTANLSIDRTNAGRALQRLQQEGYILRTKDSADKRANLVQLTEKGQETVHAIGKLRKQLVQTFFGSLTEAEAETAIALLRKSLEPQV